MSADLQIENFAELIKKGQSFIDVRAPIEFSQGHLPQAVNLPILNDEERKLVGIVYKNEGNAAAVELGRKLISGETKRQRVQAWISHLQAHPDSVIYCFRGGQRSSIAQAWISEAGVSCPRLRGGYKRARRFLIDSLDTMSKRQEFILVSGPTGSGKSLLLEEVDYPVLNLEQLANHRGSAFGAYPSAQPSQAQFENQLSAAFLRLSSKLSSQKKILIEDESRMIGKCVVPEALFQAMRSSPVIWIEESISVRVENIFQDYILNSPLGKSQTEKSDPPLAHTEAERVFSGFKNSLLAISKKLGGLKYREVLQDLCIAEQAYFANGSLEQNKKWIEQLLVHYYDPFYKKSLELRKVKILFRGSRQQCHEFINSI